MLKCDKTTGWIASDFMKAMKHLPWIFRNFSSLVKEQFDKSTFNIKDYTDKMCIAYLKTRNENILQKR